jgi:hypothetical protein
MLETANGFAGFEKCICGIREMEIAFSPNPFCVFAKSDSPKKNGTSPASVGYLAVARTRSSGPGSMVMTSMSLPTSRAPVGGCILVKMPEGFSDRIGELLKARPFQTFSIRTSDGAASAIDAPADVARTRRGDSAYYMPDDRLVMIRAEQVVDVELA